ncbi:M48 family metalloprotease [Paraburkholderia sp. Ac-20347]|uniref:M48 family metalloprotease n=1 Tax=Paraburkholderia sp. Ac-20347 TaxID=2703892 RepID=UPI00197F3928|nr:M48 family metalloprotease [Paraburkholderia sp. Ac-20347]MBN3809424.1 M48 family metalloprotease [Paraburkholderia sp. Ac-20347]
MKKDFIARCTPWGTIRTGPGFRFLSPQEKAAVLAHERGHIAKRHALKRLSWVITLRALRDLDGFLQMCKAQEYEADQHAVSEGHLVGMQVFLAKRIGLPAGPGYPSARDRLEALHG